MSKTNYNIASSSGEHSRYLGSGGFKGADFSSAPAFVSPDRFSDLKNVYRDYKNGLGSCVETFPGFRRIFHHIVDHMHGVDGYPYPAKINGIGRFRCGITNAKYTEDGVAKTMDISGDYIVVHSDKYVWMIKESSIVGSDNFFNVNTEGEDALEGYYDIASIYQIQGKDGWYHGLGYEYGDVFAPYSFINDDFGSYMIPDEPSAMFQHGENMYILCGGEYYMVSPVESAKSATPHSLSEKVFFFLYKVEGYIPTTYLNGEAYEQPNMLTRKFKEQQTVTSVEQEGDTSTEYKETFTMYIHEKVSRVIGFNNPVQHISSVTVDGDEITTSNSDSTYYTLNFSGGFVSSITITSKQEVLKPGIDLQGKTIIVYGERADATYSFSDKTTFSEANPTYTGSDYDAIRNCRIVSTFDGRTFFSGNPELPGLVFYSQRDLTGYDNPEYFGCLNYIMLGADGTGITAMISMANNLAVLKNDTVQSASIYYLTGSDTGDDLVPRIYTVTSGLPGIGCKGAACNFLDDAVFMTKNGIYGINKQSVNLERTLGARSSLVNGRMLHENPNNAVMAEWEGYLCILFKGNGHLYLADSRQTSSGEYEWYYVDAIGSWKGDRARYTYAKNQYTSAALYGDSNGEIGAYVGIVTESPYEGDIPDDDTPVYKGHIGFGIVNGVPSSSVPVWYIQREGTGEYHLVEPDGSRIGGIFCPATKIFSFNDHLIFGNDYGDLLMLNTDMRGVPNEEEASDEGFSEEEYKAECGNIIRPKWYTFCGHKYESFVQTNYDECGIPHLTKSTVNRSTVADMKTMPGSSFIFKVYTGVDSWISLDSSPSSVPDFSLFSFGEMNFNGDLHTVVPIKERTRKWIRKMYRIESNGFASPFGINKISYRFTVAGRIK